MNYQNDLREGMTVYASDGEKLGKIAEKQADLFVIEKGFFFRKDYLCRYDLISDVRDDGVHLSTTGKLLSEQNLEDTGATRARPAMPSQGMSSEGRYASGETRIPIAEEELEATKRGYQAGEVKIHKDVVTETKQVSIPLRHEEVTVERVAANPDRPAGEGAFKESTTTIPVYEEEAEIRKRPVVREEVRVGKEGFTEERRASESVRKERVDVERTGDVNWRGDKPKE